MESSEILFQDNLQVSIRRDDDKQVTTTSDLIICLRLVTKEGSKTINLEMTSDIDHFLFYSLDVAEDDFIALKADQLIHVDFNEFPSQLVNLLKECKNSTESNSKCYLASMICVDEEGRFNISQSNEFRQLSHISLKLRKGNDASIMLHLSAKLSSLKKSNGTMKEEYASMETSYSSRLSQAEKTCEKLSRKLETSIRDHSVEIKEMTLEYAKELNIEKERCKAIERDLEAKYELNLRESCSNLENKIQSLRKENQKLQDRNDEFKTKISDIEFYTKQLEAQNSTLQGSVSKLKSEVVTLEEKLSDAASTRGAIENELNNMKIGNATMEQNQYHQEDTIGSLNSQVEENRTRSRELESMLETSKENEAILKEKLNTAIQEIHKANNCINEQQKQILLQHRAIKGRNQEFEKISKDLREKKRSNDEWSSLESKLRKEVESLKEQLISRDQERTRFISEIDRQKKIIGTNMNLINWLEEKVPDSNLDFLGNESGLNSSYLSNSRAYSEPSRIDDGDDFFNENNYIANEGIENYGSLYPNTKEFFRTSIGSDFFSGQNSE